jgi:hypothetical protein
MEKYWKFIPEFQSLSSDLRNQFNDYIRLICYTSFIRRISNTFIQRKVLIYISFKWFIYSLIQKNYNIPKTLTIFCHIKPSLLGDMYLEIPSAFDTLPFYHRPACITLNAGKHKAKYCVNDVITCIVWWMVRNKHAYGFCNADCSSTCLRT